MSLWLELRLLFQTGQREPEDLDDGGWCGGRVGGIKRHIAPLPWDELNGNMVALSNSFMPFGDSSFSS